MSFYQSLAQFQKDFPQVQVKAEKLMLHLDPRILAFAAPLKEYERYAQCIEFQAKKKDSSRSSAEPKDPIETLFENSFERPCPIEFLSIKTAAAWRWAMLVRARHQEEATERARNVQKWAKCCQERFANVHIELLTTRYPKVSLQECDEYESKGWFGLSDDQVSNFALASRAIYMTEFQRREYQPCHEFLVKHQKGILSEEEEDEFNECLVQNSPDLGEDVQKVRQCWSQNANHLENCIDIVASVMSKAHNLRVEKFKKLTAHL